MGETGQGKSSIVNHICEASVAIEGKGIKSQTSEVEVFEAKSASVHLVDTPGFFDTRKEMKNDKIMNDIIKKVSEELQHKAHIAAIFLVWNPNLTLRFRLDEMLDTLTKSLGEDALKSLIIVVNKISKSWTELQQDAVQELSKMIDEKGLGFPIIILDAKAKLTSRGLEAIKSKLKEVEPYKEENFDVFRKEIYFKQYIQFQEEEKKKMEEKKKEEELKVKIKAELENEYKKKMTEIEEKYQKSLQESLKTYQKALDSLDKTFNAMISNKSSSNTSGFFSSSSSYANSILPQNSSFLSSGSYASHNLTNVSYTSGGPLKKDGTPDMRYKANRINPYLTKGGRPDRRFKINK